MSARHNHLLETHIVGAQTRQVIVRAEECPALAQQHVSHVGVGDAAVPYQIVRTQLSGAYLHGTLGGEGRMLLDGRWQSHRSGMSSFAPAHVLHAFHAIPSRRWQYCWVRYMPQSPRSRISTMAPVLVQFNTEALSQAILGLAREMEHGAETASCALWVELIERYVDRFIEPWRKEARLVTLWRAVLADLDRAWSLEDLAAIANTSGEHLRRLCQRALGRSPMQQLAHLRMQHAAHLLVTTHHKIDVVARLVGYQNPFAFSNTFKKMTGLRPSIYRARHAGEANDDIGRVSIARSASGAGASKDLV